MTADTPVRRWRVNVDVRHGQLTPCPGADPHRTIDELVGRGVPLALIDLDRSIDGTADATLLERAVRRHPGRIWVGGRLSAADPASTRLLDAGAAGVVIGSSSLFGKGAPDPEAFRALTRLPDTGRVMVSVDALDERVVVDGFTRGTDVAVDDALARVAASTGGHCDVIYTDATAALHRTRPDFAAVEALAARHPALPLWYAGGLSSWADMHRLWDAGLGGVVGRSYLRQRPWGLPAHRSDRPLLLPEGT